MIGFLSNEALAIVLLVVIVVGIWKGTVTLWNYYKEKEAKAEKREEELLKQLSEANIREEKSEELIKSTNEINKSLVKQSERVNKTNEMLVSQYSNIQSGFLEVKTECDKMNMKIDNLTDIIKDKDK